MNVATPPATFAPTFTSVEGISATVENVGSHSAPLGIPVAFYQGDRAVPEALIGVALAGGPLAPGESGSIPPSRRRTRTTSSW